MPFDLNKVLHTVNSVRPDYLNAIELTTFHVWNTCLYNIRNTDDVYIQTFFPIFNRTFDTLNRLCFHIRF